MKWKLLLSRSCEAEPGFQQVLRGSFQCWFLRLGASRLGSAGLSLNSCSATYFCVALDKPLNFSVQLPCLHSDSCMRHFLCYREEHCILKFFASPDVSASSVADPALQEWPVQNAAFQTSLHEKGAWWLFSKFPRGIWPSGSKPVPLTSNTNMSSVWGSKIPNPMTEEQTV